MIDGTINTTLHIDADLIDSKPLEADITTTSNIDGEIQTPNLLEADVAPQNSEIGATLETGTLIGNGEGSTVIVNPPDEPSGHMRTIKVNTETYDLDEVDPTVPEWAKTPSKPNYTAEEVGAVDVDNELAYAEIDRMFNAVFGI